MVELESQHQIRTPPSGSSEQPLSAIPTIVPRLGAWSVLTIDKSMLFHEARQGVRLFASLLFPIQNISETLTAPNSTEIQ